MPYFRILTGLNFVSVLCYYISKNEKRGEKKFEHFKNFQFIFIFGIKRLLIRIQNPKSGTVLG